MSLIPFEGAIEGIVNVINKFIPDTASRDAAKAAITEQLLTIASTEDAAQADINKVEAAGTFFESGWRPFIGWTCGLAFSGHYVWSPTFFFLRSCWDSACVAQPYDMVEISNVLYLLLGFGAMRTVDKSVGSIMKAIKP